VDPGGPNVTPTITIEDVDQATKEVIEESNTQNGQPMPGSMPEGPAPAIPDWYKVGWRAHAGVDDPTPTEEEKDRAILEQWLSEMYYGDWYHSAFALRSLTTCSHSQCYI
jgi:hypothetical protein